MLLKGLSDNHSSLRFVREEGKVAPSIEVSDALFNFKVVREEGNMIRSTDVSDVLDRSNVCKLERLENMIRSIDVSDVPDRSNLYKLDKLEKAPLDMVLMGLSDSLSSRSLLDWGFEKCRPVKEVNALLESESCSREDGKIIFEIIEILLFVR